MQFSEEHKMFKKMVRDFVDKEIRPNVEKWEDEGRTPREVWQKCGELGFLGIHYPKEVGGQGLDYSFTALFHEEMAKCGSPGVALGLCVQTDMATPALAHHGSDFLRKEYLVPAIKGEMISSIAVSEPNAGSDVASIRTQAKRDGDDWVINGTKTFITNGTQCDFICLLARTSDEPGYKGMSLFVVPSKTPGFSRGKTLKKVCFHSSDTAEIILENVRVSKDHLIGEEGKGFIYQMQQFQVERLGGCVMSLGAIKQCYQLTKKYIFEREAFGSPLVKMQTIRHKMAQMAAEISVVESAVRSCVAKSVAREDFTKEVSMLKLIMAQVQHRVMDECVQIHGGWGLMSEYEVARYFRDVKLAAIGGGTNEVMKEIISKMEGFEQ